MATKHITIAPNPQVATLMRQIRLHAPSVAEDFIIVSPPCAVKLIGSVVVVVLILESRLLENIDSKIIRRVYEYGLQLVIGY